MMASEKIYVNYCWNSLPPLHPAIKAASPQAPVNDWFIGDDWHHNGAFFLAHMFNWMSRNGRKRPAPTKKFPRATFDYGTPDGYEFYRRIKTLSEIVTALPILRTSAGCI